MHFYLLTAMRTEPQVEVKTHTAALKTVTEKCSMFRRLEWASLTQRISSAESGVSTAVAQLDQSACSDGRSCRWWCSVIDYCRTGEQIKGKQKNSSSLLWRLFSVEKMFLLFFQLNLARTWVTSWFCSQSGRQLPYTHTRSLELESSQSDLKTKIDGGKKLSSGGNEIITS